jgi:hypothetical protein
MALRETALRVAQALGGHDEIALVAKARASQRDVRLVHASAPERATLSLPIALLRPLRLLGVTGVGPRYVAELPFPQVEVAIAASIRFGGSRASLDDWMHDEELRGWTSDATPWARRVERVRATAGSSGWSETFAACDGRVVMSFRECEMPAGPFDGAEAVELIFDDGTAVALPVAGADPVPVLGAQLIAHGDGRTARWIFQTPASGQVFVSLLGRDGVVLQNSPLPEETRPAGMARQCLSA